MSLQVEHSESKKENQSPSSLTYIPQELTLNSLARLSRSHYPRLSLVSKTFNTLLSSTELYAVRSRIGTTEQCFYVCLRDLITQFPHWFTLMTSGRDRLLVPIKSPQVCNESNPNDTPTVVVGSDLYVLDGTTVRILDCRSHTWRDAPSMNVARKCVVSCVYNGKIYVMGGNRVLEAEVFDVNNQTWRNIRCPRVRLEKPYVCRVGEVGGKIYFQNFAKLYVYDPEGDEWDSWDDDSVCVKMECVVENVSYCYFTFAPTYEYMFKWYDVKDKKWKEVKGLESLANKYTKKGEVLDFYCVKKLVSFGKKFLLVWEGCMINDAKNIWCAEIMVEKRDGGEVWGTVEWVDVIHTGPASHELLRCVAVSV